jgi:predicted RNA-binding Zn-ribbon protein involved in translation (DUF1610 family)
MNEVKQGPVIATAPIYAPAEQPVGEPCPWCGSIYRSHDIPWGASDWYECSNVDCEAFEHKFDEPPGDPEQCAVITFHGSHNDMAANFGPDERCEEYAIPGKDVCVRHDYEPL